MFEASFFFTNTCHCSGNLSVFVFTLLVYSWWAVKRLLCLIIKLFVSKERINLNEGWWQFLCYNKCFCVGVILDKQFGSINWCCFWLKDMHYVFIVQLKSVNNNNSFSHQEERVSVSQLETGMFYGHYQRSYWVFKKNNVSIILKLFDRNRKLIMY